jgi:hypothetical protein
VIRLAEALAALSLATDAGKHITAAQQPVAA